MIAKFLILREVILPAVYLPGRNREEQQLTHSHSRCLIKKNTQLKNVDYVTKGPHINPSLYYLRGKRI